MSVELGPTCSGIIPTGHMADGQIGVIVNSIAYNGTIVQRYGDALVAIGQDMGQGWSIGCSRSSPLKARLLGVGDTIVITEN